jgi:ParB family chromosome partitioning protein
MGKADELLRSMGGIITESASHRGTPAAMPSAPAGAALASERLAGVTRSKAALEIPVSRIVPDPDQPREEFDPEALGRLAESLKVRGVLQPIRVRWDEGKGSYVIIAGERRWRAAGIAGLAALPCVVDDRPATQVELLAIQIVENCLREDLKPIEQARAYRAMMELNGWSGNQLAKELGVAQSGVVQALALLELPATVRAAVDSGELPASTAYAITALEDPAAQAEVAARVVAEGLSRAETVAAVRRATGGKGRGRARGKASKPTSRVFRKAAGCTVTVENGKGLEPATVAAALEAALSTVRAELGANGQAAA